MASSQALARLAPVLQTFWSGVGRELAKVSLLSSFSGLWGYILRNPIRSSLQALGGVSMLFSAITVPVLGVLGFSAAGPVASSFAVGWQSSLGLVQAGSLFSWCQGVAMGGAAASGLVTTGLRGAGVVGAATLGPALKEKIAALLAQGGRG